jgi:predicted metalloenzyme YecM
MNKNSFLEELKKYVDRVEEFFLNCGVSFENINLDHVCFKCSSSKEFEEVREWFEGEDALIYQAIISKRRIATIKLLNPIKLKNFLINTLELSDQKPDNSQKSGVDHVEICSKNLSYEELKNFFESKGFKLVLDSKPHHTTYNILEDGLEVKLADKSLLKIVSEEILKN